MKRGSAWPSLFVVLLAACEAPDDTALGGSPPAEVRITEATRVELAKHAPGTLPAPPLDVSNRYADDPAAAALGQRFFFDTGFSGALLDPDNDGNTPQALGEVGDTGRVGCVSCHVPDAAFVDNRSTRQQVSLAAGWGVRRTKSLLDIGQARILMWDGRRDALYNQPFQPIETATEMNSSRLFVAQEIHRRYRAEYEAVFGPIPIPLDDTGRFPELLPSTTGCRGLDSDDVGVDCHGMPGDGAEYDGLSESDKTEVTRVAVNFGKALGAYERLLACGPGRFDAWMAGDEDALSDAEKRGAALFVGQRQDGSSIASCSSCHSGPFFTDQDFHNVGMKPQGVGPAGSFYDLDDHGAADGLSAALNDPLNVRGPFSDGDDGRLPTSVPANADGAFRTPSLRCVAMRNNYMHTGQLITLEKVVSFFARGGNSDGFVGEKEIGPRDYTEQEEADLVAFMRTLDGEGPDPSLLAPPP